jgi:hypothetical protein
VKRAAFLALLVAQASLAQEREVVQVRDGLLRDVAGAEHRVTGGLYLPSESAVATARELAALRAEVKVLRAEPAGRGGRGGRRLRLRPPTLTINL